MKPSSTTVPAAERDSPTASPGRATDHAGTTVGSALERRVRRLRSVLVLAVSLGLLTAGLFFGGFLVFAEGSRG